MNTTSCLYDRKTSSILALGALLLAAQAAEAQLLRAAPLAPPLPSVPLGVRTHADPGVPNDALFSLQWGPQQVHAEDAWHVTTGAGAVIAIVDSGLDLEHGDLAANVVGGITFLSCGDSGCGNGDWQEGHVHGTHVAGIAAAVADNGIGIAGVAPAAGLLAVRVLDADGSGSFEDIARGIRWSADQGADVVNLSLGALPGVQVLTLTGLVGDVVRAIEYANSRGVVVVAAAGNEAVPLCDTPAFDPGVVCVTATDKREVKAWYANAPVNFDAISVAAPGGAALPGLCHEDIVSTVPAGTGSDACGYPSDRAYDELAGTSMATPHVAGVAALLASMGCTREQTISLITSTARQPFLSLRGVWSPAYGYGIVDAAAATGSARNVCAPAGGN